MTQYSQEMAEYRGEVYFVDLSPVQGREQSGQRPVLVLSIDAINRLRGLDLPSDPLFGRTFYSIGLIEGGVAPNVISPKAAAEVLFRTVGPADALLATLSPLQELVDVQEVLRVNPQHMHTIGGFETSVFPFTTDVPLLDRWGAPLLFGPGSFLVAHTDAEHLRLDELAAAVDAYARLASTLLGD